MPEGVVDQKRLVRIALAVMGTVALLGAILVVIYFSTDIPVRLLIADPAELAQLREYAGLYNNLAILVLWTGAVVAGLSAWIGSFPDRGRRRFVVTVAGITAGLAIDDWFMVHEVIGLWLAWATSADDVLRRRQTLEGYVFAVMVLTGIVWLGYMRREIMRSPWLLLLVGILGFGVSVAMDIGPRLVDVLTGRPLWVRTTWMVGEELAKYIGMGGFAMYAIMTAIPYLRRETDFH